MNLPEEAPKLPKLPFLALDAVLIAAAVFIALASDSPLGTEPLLAIVLCVALGAVLAALPFLADYARRQDALLNDRQDQIAALARTTAQSAEQLSIAAASLHGIAEASSRQLKLAEQLPAAFQEQITELKRLLALAAPTPASSAPSPRRAEADAAARAAETAQLTAVVDKIARTAADLARIETATARQLAALDQHLALLPALAGQATETLAQAGAQAQARLDETLAKATAAALATFEQQLAATTARRETRPPETPPSALPPAAAAAAALTPPSDAPDTPAAPRRKRFKFTESAISTEISAAASTQIAQSPPPAAAAPEPAAPPDNEIVVGPPASTPAEPTPLPPPAPNPTPSPLAEAGPAPDDMSASPAFPAADPSPDEVPVDDAPRARLRKFKAPEAGPELDLGLPPTDDGDSGPPAAETSVSSDGFTRLIATAYIGIGNKLYIRGSGPGLSWEKGVPLQFVSIGKWRWETPDASAPLTIKLYKNDQLECTALGPLTLKPAHQHEISATF